LIYNYHTHTVRCSHASGSVEEYIKVAIQNGIKYMGFSDHSPFAFPDGYESPHRVPLSEAKDYFNEIDALRKKYINEIDIKIGFEMEYYPKHFDEMLDIAKKSGAEYLILGQHFLRNEYPDGIPSSAPTDSVDNLIEYSDTVVRAIKSGVFTYIAHPDMINFTGDKDIYVNEMHKICVAAREENVPLEINFLGIRTYRNYPRDLFWKIAGEEKSPITFGFDAHDAPSAFDGESLKTAKALVEKYNLNYIGKPKLKAL